MRTEGWRLLQEHKAGGVRQVDIARATGRTEPTVYGWLLGISIPDTISAVRLKEHFGIPVEAWTQKPQRKAS